MSVTLQKLNQTRKKVKEREGILQNGNYYDLEDAEMSSLHSVTGLILEWTSADNEVRVPLSVFRSKPQRTQKYFPNWAGRMAFKTVTV